MPTVNINITHENLPQGVTNQQRTLDLIIRAVKTKYNDSLTYDQRKVFSSIYSKIKAAIIAATNNVNLTTDETGFIKGAFIECRFTAEESIDVYKLELLF